MQRRRASSFTVFLTAGLGACVTVVLALIVGQASFLSGHTNPLRGLADADTFEAVKLSLFCASLASTLSLLFAIPAAYSLSRWRSRLAMVLDAILDIPVILSPIVIGIALILLFRTRGGQWIEAHIVRVVFEVPGIVLAQFILALALQIRVLKSTFEEVDPRYEQVARFLGCTEWGAFRRVTLPMSRSGILAAFVLGWSRALGDFGATVTIAGAVRGKTETIPVSIYLNLSSVRIGKAVALTLLLTALAFFVLITIRWLSRTEDRVHGDER